MNKLFVFVLVLGIFAIGFTANAQTADKTVSPVDTAQTSKDQLQDKQIGNWDNNTWGGFAGGMKGYDGKIKVGKSFGHGDAFGTLWMIGWLFTIGYLQLSFWRGVLALIIWPYYIGKKFKPNQ